MKLAPHEELRIAVDRWCAAAPGRDQTALACEIGVRRPNLTVMIHGKRWFPGYVPKLEKALGVTIPTRVD